MDNLVLLLDIGTTTISGAILDCAKRRILSSDSALNSQSKFGDDVISRIDFALKEPANAKLLHDGVVLSVNKLLSVLLNKASKKSKDIKACFCACNTAMHHLFLGINTTSLITPPYKATQKSEITIYADRVGLKLKKNVPVTFLPNIGGFVGSDALAIILASEIYKSKAIKLAVDIGTNGEIILGNKDKILVSSTAAGPAFEGRHISCGMPAICGAIESVKIRKGGVDIKVIEGGAPKGIAGSGLVDCAYQMLKNKIIDKSGRMKTGEFILYKKGKTKISVTQQDIRKLQLAKAATHAAIRVLLRRAGIEREDISEILITGSFGNTLNTRSIAGIGLIPHANKAKVKFLRAGVLEGLRLYVTKPHLRKRLLGILSKTQHIPLLGRGFGDEFTSSLSIG